jgi:thiosulfate/3-mercaptopyruvate sulfurtransferase
VTPLIDPVSLASALADARPVRLLDVRWRLDLPEGRPAYLGGHLPGAVYVDLERELSNPGHPEEGRHPLPPLSALQGAVRRWGIRAGDLAVAYDDNDGVAAARLWWLLRRRGVDVRVLDGGLRGWIESGGLLEGGDVLLEEGDVVLTDGDIGEASIDAAARAGLAGTLVDARSPQHYRGVAPTVDPAAGHIPGARNIPTLAHVDGNGRLRAPDHIRRTLEQAGLSPADPLVVYCGSGIAAAHTALALAHAGAHARVFPGSWSRWSRTAGRPVAVGPSPWGEVTAAR